MTLRILTLLGIFIAVFVFPSSSFGQIDDDDDEVIESKRYLEAERKVAPEVPVKEEPKIEPVKPRKYRTAQSGTLVKENLPEKKIELSINPELYIGGMFSNYRDLGYFNFVNFGGGIGFTYLEKWHFRLSLWAMYDPHEWEDQLTHDTQTIGLWFIQPTAQAMINVAHFAKWHYHVPMDLNIGVKLGANVFLADKSFGGQDDEVNVLYGFVLLPRFRIWQGFGLAPSVELGTIDYFKNFFLQYGLVLFWDFEVLGEK